MADKDESNGKWAAEAYDFLRLHQRVGSRIYGLVLLEFAWAALLWLLTNITPDDDPHVIGMPWLSSDVGGGLSAHFAPVALANLFIPGALVIFAVWVVVSRLHLFLTRPFLQIL
jgi:hypothetical protein